MVVLLCVMSMLGVSMGSEVLLPQGRVRGRYFDVRGGKKVEGYLGIPYAAPPLGQLRFKSPQPASSWTGVLEATTDTPGCIQPIGPPVVPIRPREASEDCLYLNIFTPSSSTRTKFPVLVFIYGGSFETGSGSSSAYGPDYLLENRDIVLVTFTYRAGLLGFLSLEEPILSGNLGLKDQRAALQWVHENIRWFCGDATRVTVYGESAGAASVHFHLTSTYKQGLFRAAIASSASARSYWALQPPSSQRHLVAALANLTNCPPDPQTLLDCLRLVPATNFLDITHTLKRTCLEIKSRSPVFTPVLEAPSVDDAIIINDSWDSTSHITLLQGVNQLEGLFRTVDFETDKTDNRLKLLDKYWQEVVPYNLYLESRTEEPRALADSLRHFYFGNASVDRDHFLNFVDLVSDALYNYGVVESTRANKGKTYFYQFNYKGANSLVHYLGSDAYYGVSHVDDLFFLFPFGGPSLRNITENDTLVSKQLVKMFTNFVKYLDPTPGNLPVKWKPVSTPSIEYLNIGQHSYTMDKDILKTRIDFWSSLPLKSIKYFE